MSLSTTRTSGSESEQLASEAAVVSAKDSWDIVHKMAKDFGLAVAPQVSGLRSQVGLLWQVLERTDVAVFWKNRVGLFLGANDKCCETFGFEREQLIGKHDLELFESEAAMAYAKADMEVMEKGEPIDVVETVESPDGRTETLRTSKIPVRDGAGEVIGVVGCFHVVTTVKQTEQALRTLEGRYALALDASQDGMWELDLVERVVELSPRFVELFEVDERLGRQLSIVEVCDALGLDETEMTELLRPVVRGDSAQLAMEHSQVMADGSTRWFQLVGYPYVDEEAVITHMIGSAADITDKIERERKLVHQANHDDLTGLANRRALIERLNSAIEAGTPLGLLCLDIDRFKLVNDSMGHHVGDQLLCAVAERLDSFIEPNQMLARLGGDEFAIFLPDSGEAEAEEVGQKVLDALASPIALNGNDFYITCSAGATYSAAELESAIDLLRDADNALSKAKAEGKACMRMFEPWMRAAAEEKLELQNRISRAVERTEFVLHYQPIFDSQSGAMHAVEGLIRWAPEHDGELHRPDMFLPYLEQTGLIVDVGEWVICEAIQQLAQWRRDSDAARHLKVSLNLSRAQFRSPVLAEAIVGSLARHNMQPHDLVLEVTETAITDNPQGMIDVLEQVRVLGVEVAIDDFGVGQSSLSSLYDLPVDIIKMDRAFVSRIETDRPEPMVEAVLTMARSAGLRAIAEGVETEAQRRYLEAADCAYMQGYLLGRPVPADKIGEMLR